MRATDDMDEFRHLEDLLTKHGVTAVPKKQKIEPPMLHSNSNITQSSVVTNTLFILGIILISAVLTMLFSRADVPISTNRLQLGDPVYDMQRINAPSLSGYALSIVSTFLSTSRFAPWIRRALLNENHIEVIRELSSQISLPPIDYPMLRLSEGEWKDAELNAAWHVSSAKNALHRGFQGKSLRFDEYATAMDYHNAYTALETSPSLVLRIAISKIKEWEKQGLPIFASINESEVRKQTEESDLRYKQGRPLSVLDGVPIAFKDVVDIYGVVTFNGKNPKGAWDDISTDPDDLMVSRFRELGAIILGTTVMTEGGTSPMGYNTHYKGPTNAYSEAHYSGGSSSGSAVAVATGLVPIAIGFDSGGSIRLPAAWSGVHGLAPTFGRVPLEKETYMSMMKAGPIALSAVDAALAYAALVPTTSDRNSFYSVLYDGGNLGPPHAHLMGFTDTEDLSNIRIGIFPEWFSDATPDVEKLASNAIAYFISRGAQVVNITIPHLRWMSLAHGIKISTEYALEWDLLYHTRLSELEPNTRLMMALAASLSGLEVIAADRLRAWAFNFTISLFKEHRLSVMATPTIGFTPPLLQKSFKSHGVSDTSQVMAVMKHVFLANFVGLPAYSVPMGTAPCPITGIKLPLGLQLIGSHWNEHILLRMANALDFNTKIQASFPSKYFSNALTKSKAIYKKLKTMPRQT